MGRDMECAACESRQPVPSVVHKISLSIPFPNLTILGNVMCVLLTKLEPFARANVSDYRCGFCCYMFVFYQEEGPLQLHRQLQASLAFE